MKIDYNISVGATNYRSGGGLTLDLETMSSMREPANSCRLTFGFDDDFAVSVADEVRVELGRDGATQLVFSGKVTGFYFGGAYIFIEAFSSFSVLLATRLNLAFEEPSAGDIVKDVLGQLKVDVEQAETGLDFVTYALHDGSSVYEHLLYLAQKCGFDFYCSPADGAIFAKYAPQKNHVFRYGIHIINFETATTRQAYAGVRVNGESPFGQGQGKDASSWLTKKEAPGSVGENTGVLRIDDGTIRTKDLANSAAKNIWQDCKRTVRGKLCLPGAPAVQIGDSVETADMPVETQNGKFKVAGVRHRLNQKIGFCTDVFWEANDG